MSYTPYNPYDKENYPAFAGYDNFVLANEIMSSLLTKLDFNRFCTADFSLTERPGMVKKIHKYSCVNGVVDELDRGEDSKNVIEAAFVEEEYRVKRKQGEIDYFWDDQMTDEALVSAKLKYLGESMANDFTRRALLEMGKTTNVINVDPSTGLTIDDVADAISIYTGEFESTAGLFLIANQKMDAKLRKILEPELRYVEDYVKVGAISTIWGIPIFLSKAVPENCLFLATREAVTCFIARSLDVEQDHDIGTKMNRVVASVYNVTALTNEKKCIFIGPAQATTLALTTYTKAGTTIAGAATTGANVVAYVNGVEAGHATAASSEFSITADVTLKAGDIVKVVAYLEGYGTQTATATVAD